MKNLKEQRLNDTIGVNMFELTMEPKEKASEKTTTEVKKPRRATVLKRNNRNLYRRAYGETVLMDITKDDNFKDGDCYNYITGGDVDSLSFLRLILRQQNIKHLLFSTWCMASEDIYNFYKDYYGGINSFE